MKEPILLKSSLKEERRMTYNTKVFNYSNLTEEVKQIVVAQLLMLDSLENVITEYTFSNEAADNQLERISYQEGIKALIEAKQSMYDDIIEWMVFAIEGYEHEIEEVDTDDFFYGLYPESENK